MRSENSTDDLVLLLAGVFLAGAFVPTFGAKIFPALRGLLVDWHVLVTENVMIPVVDGAGLDFGRILIAVGLVGVAVLLAIAAFRMRRARADRKGI